MGERIEEGQVTHTPLRYRRRQILAAVAGAVGGVMLPAPAPSPGGVAAAGGTLTYAHAGRDAVGFHPYIGTDPLSRLYAQAVFGGGLVKHAPGATSADSIVVGEKGDRTDFAGDTASAWKRSADTRTYTFTLREMQWSDGTPVTADDYVWTFRQIMKPEHDARWREFFAPVVAYFAPSPTTLLVNLRRRTGTGLVVAGSLVPLPKHVWERYDWADPVRNPEMLAPTVGNGMWSLRERVAGDHATFVPNPRYFDRPPQIGSFTVRLYPTSAAVHEALRAGEANWASIAPSAYARVQALPDIGVSEWYTPEGEWAYLGFNLRRPALQEPLVRKAIAHATDRGRIIGEVLAGRARPMDSTLPPSNWAHLPSVERYDFDPALARNLLRQAGYATNGSRLTKDGHPLTFTLLHADDREADAGIAALLVRQLDDLGIAVTVRALPPEDLRAALTTEPFDYDLSIGHWASLDDPSFTAPLWSEGAIPQQNSGAYHNPEVNRLYQEAVFELESDLRRPLFATIQKRLAADVPCVFLYEAKQMVAFSGQVGGVTVGEFGLNPMNEWTVVPT